MGDFLFGFFLSFGVTFAAGVLIIWMRHGRR
jgi:hypothetical protein